jgi:hypothetical protein
MMVNTGPGHRDFGIAVRKPQSRLRSFRIAVAQARFVCPRRAVSERQPPVKDARQRMPIPTLGPSTMR